MPWQAGKLQGKLEVFDDLTSSIFVERCCTLLKNDLAKLVKENEENGR